MDNSRLLEVQKEIEDFNNERGWDIYHTPQNLAKSISIEAAELLECFQWNDKYDLTCVKDEVADVMIYCLDLARVLDIDLIKTIQEKIKKNGKKYPINGEPLSNKK